MSRLRQGTVGQRADGRTSPSADRIQRRSRVFPGRMRPTRKGPRYPGGEVCGQRSGRARIRRNLGLTPYRPPGCWPRWPFGPFRYLTSIPRGVKDKLPSDVYPVQAACRCLRPDDDVEAWSPVPGQAERVVLESSPRPVGGKSDVPQRHAGKDCPASPRRAPPSASACTARSRICRATVLDVAQATCQAQVRRRTPHCRSGPARASPDVDRLSVAAPRHTSHQRRAS